MHIRIRNFLHGSCKEGKKKLYWDQCFQTIWQESWKDAYGISNFIWNNVNKEFKTFFMKRGCVRNIEKMFRQGYRVNFYHFCVNRVEVKPKRNFYMRNLHLVWTSRKLNVNIKILTFFWKNSTIYIAEKYYCWKIFKKLNQIPNNF